MKTIYLADDDEDDRMLIRLALEQVTNHTHIVEFDAGDQLIRLIGNQELPDDPAVIIMDMNMPRMNGLETLSLLKASKTCRHIPVVMLSSASHRDLIREAYGRGVNAFVEKPVYESDFVRLAKAVDACFLDVGHADQPLPGNPGKEGSIIVIEDNEDHRFFIRHALRETMPAVRVVEFSDAADVTERLGPMWNDIRPAPHLILMDLYLPTRQDGLDLLINIHQLLVAKDSRSVPVVVFSCSDKFEDMRESYQHNANAYMTKGNNASDWKYDFRNLHHFWWNTVSIPEYR
ncbi:response regulator [Dyadobacter sp. 676]|uniref:Response regulator n=1 Tax=Dyadobacter sp. 676 TaxID=3088362 RepID=A0AAU8FP71_9BACT